ncbi:MAG: SCO family protein, partial [Thermoflexibacteraceae bacterium]
MNSQYKKIIFLVAILAIPSAIYLFLASQGKNTYKIQVFNPKSEMCPPNNTTDTMHRIPPFQLISQDNKPFSNKDLDGKVYVADFFFTRCPNICLVMTS